jgi:hypothetical protein
MLEKVLIIIITTIISALITYFISSLINNKIFQKSIDEAIKVHEKVWHQDSMYRYVEDQIEKHINQCGAEGVKKELVSLKQALTFLVVKHEGNPRDFGL